MNCRVRRGRKYLNDLFNLPTYSVDKSHYEEQKGTIPVVKEYLHVLSPNYASVSGKRLVRESRSFRPKLLPVVGGFGAAL